MLHLQTITGTYWTKDFEVTQSDLEFIYNLFLEEETPLKTPELIQRLIDFRIDNEFKKLTRHHDKGEIFQPANAYKLGQDLIFPAFDFASGKVISQRPGKNPHYGEFTVLKVELEDGRQLEVASCLKGEHKLNQDLSQFLNYERPNAADIYEKYKRSLTPAVVDALREDDDMLFIAKRWFLKSLLLDVNVAHLNLAEAVLDINDGGPLETRQIIKEVGFGEDANPILQTVSFDYALSQDERFDEVGPAGQVLWYLRRMEPPEIQETPKALRYPEISYNPDALNDELIELEEQIDDELSDIQLVDEDDLQDEAAITLNYPHWRSGTLPLTQRAEHLFPIAYRTPRIRMTLIDGKSLKEMQGWVVREQGYVFGLADFYRRHRLPIGAIIQVRPDDEDPSKVVVDFESHNPRRQWVLKACPEADRLRFEESQQMIGVEYDELMALAIEDLAGLDALAERYQKQRVHLSAIMAQVMRELAQFSPQGHVHAKTLYSAVNLLRRCPPGPIFAALRTDPDFLHIGGPYWRLA